MLEQISPSLKEMKLAWHSTGSRKLFSVGEQESTTYDRPAFAECK